MFLMSVAVGKYRLLEDDGGSSPRNSSWDTKLFKWRWTSKTLLTPICCRYCIFSTMTGSIGSLQFAAYKRIIFHIWTISREILRKRVYSCSSDDCQRRWTGIRFFETWILSVWLLKIISVRIFLFEQFQQSVRECYLLFWRFHNPITYEKRPSLWRFDEIKSLVVFEHKKLQRATKIQFSASSYLSSNLVKLMTVISRKL